MEQAQQGSVAVQGVVDRVFRVIPIVLAGASQVGRIGVGESQGRFLQMDISYPADGGSFGEGAGHGSTSGSVRAPGPEAISSRDRCERGSSWMPDGRRLHRC